MAGSMRIENLREPRVKPPLASQSSKPSAIGPNSGIERYLWLDLGKREGSIETSKGDLAAGRRPFRSYRLNVELKLIRESDFQRFRASTPHF